MPKKPEVVTGRALITRPRLNITAKGWLWLAAGVVCVLSWYILLAVVYALLRG